MAGSNFSFDEGALEGVVRDAAKQMAEEHERDLNRLSSQLKGQPLDDIRTALKQLYRRNDGSITEPELTEYAELIQAGTTFNVGVR